MIAANINIQPIISRMLIDCPRKINPAITENTDSRLRRSEAIAGLTFFCPSICSVYPAHPLIAPA